MSERFLYQQSSRGQGRWWAGGIIVTDGQGSHGRCYSKHLFEGGAKRKRSAGVRVTVIKGGGSPGWDMKQAHNVSAGPGLSLGGGR